MNYGCILILKIYLESCRWRHWFQFHARVGAGRMKNSGAPRGQPVPVLNLKPALSRRRYVRGRPGEMIHLDIKELGRFNRVGRPKSGDRKGQCHP